jgi:hypothetical protein
MRNATIYTRAARKTGTPQRCRVCEAVITTTSDLHPSDRRCERCAGTDARVERDVLSWAGYVPMGETTQERAA